MLDALQCEKCALDILEVLSVFPSPRKSGDKSTDESNAACSLQFRDHVLSLEPMLLETLLHQSQKSDRAFERVGSRE